MLTGLQVAQKAQEIVDKYFTSYMWGTFGQRFSDALIEYKRKQYPLKNTAFVISRILTKKKKADTDKAVLYLFDCIGLVKGILWGFPTVFYKSNEVPDWSADTFIANCKEVSSDFSSIEIGELLWISGHAGIYIGEGLAVEATSRWNDGVQVTHVFNLGKITSVGRKWAKHGKIPFVSYPKQFPVDEDIAVGRVKILSSTLNVRKGDSTKFPIIRQIKKGDIIYVYELNKAGTWGRIGKDEWICVTMNYAVFVNKAFKVQIRTFTLNIRSGASSTKYSSIGKYSRGDVVNVLEVNAEGTWGKTDRGWICIKPIYVKSYT